MITALKTIFTSKKFYIAILTGAVSAGLHYAGVSDPVIQKVIYFGLALIGGQALADFSKNSTPSA